MVRVILDLTDILMEDQRTHLIIGSHKSEFQMHEDYLSLEHGKRSEFLVSYECPAGSAIFFAENLCHARPVWERDSPCVAMVYAYSHLPEVPAGLPRAKQACFREPWIADFRTRPATHNTAERFLENDKSSINTDHKP